MKTSPSRGSHLPVLMKLFGETKGPIIEFGSGMYSSPYLHWACFSPQRPLVTVETNPQWFEYIQQFQAPWHEIICTEDLDAVDVSRNWSIAFIDHSPSTRRWKDILRVTHAEYVVAHDAENSQGRKYGYVRCHKAFKYRTKYALAQGPHTAIFSNLHDVRGLVI